MPSLRRSRSSNVPLDYADKGLSDGEAVWEGSVLQLWVRKSVQQVERDAYLNRFRSSTPALGSGGFPRGARDSVQARVFCVRPLALQGDCAGTGGGGTASCVHRYCCLLRSSPSAQALVWMLTILVSQPGFMGNRRWRLPALADRFKCDRRGGGGLGGGLGSQSRTRGQGIKGRPELALWGCTRG